MSRAISLDSSSLCICDGAAVAESVADSLESDDNSV
jgi:hypothetical protein